MSDRVGRSRGILLVGLLACLLLLRAPSGQAAPIPNSASGLAAGGTTLTACDDDVSVDYDTFWLWIYGVEVSDISSSCVDYNIEVTLSDMNGSSTGTGTSQISGDSISLATNSWYLQSSLAKTVILITP